MAVKIFAKVSYKINGVASPSIILASAWTDELNEMNSDERKILGFYHNTIIPFLAPMGDPLGTYVRSDVSMSNIPIDKSPEEIFSWFGFIENEKHPFHSYMPVIGYVGSDMITKKFVVIMNNLAVNTAHGDFDGEPAKLFFNIHKLTTAEIDNFANSYPELEPINASATDLYDLFLPHIATKNDALEADGFSQATQNGDTIVFHADCVTYMKFGDDSGGVPINPHLA